MRASVKTAVSVRRAPALAPLGRILAWSVGAALVLALAALARAQEPRLVDTMVPTLPAGAPVVITLPPAAFVGDEGAGTAPPDAPPEVNPAERVPDDAAELGPLSIGTPDAGLLVNPHPMHEGPLWTIRDPSQAYATAETIQYLLTALLAVEEAHPGSPRVVVGDISRADGGRLDRHRSHQAGRDVDLGFYYRTGEASTFRRPRRGELDLPRMWTLVRALVTRTDVQRIFIDRSILRVLHAHAVSIGESPAWLDDIFGRRTAGKDAILQHERRHQDHLHVRFYNPRAQEEGRRAYPALLEAGLVPPPSLNHRVRSGQTLSHLARRYGVSVRAIRAANGLRSSRLRIGQRVEIPVRRTPADPGPLVVPPRRLPPADVAAAEQMHPQTP
jgi:penicillin-insensitive murein endopeptidase